MKTPQKLYEIFEETRKNKKITYAELGAALGSKDSTVYDKMKRLKDGKSVHTNFLFDLEKILGKPIFFGK
jgi:hypothetical protein